MSTDAPVAADVADAGRSGGGRRRGLLGVGAPAAGWPAAVTEARSRPGGVSSAPLRGVVARCPGRGAARCAVCASRPDSASMCVPRDFFVRFAVAAANVRHRQDQIRCCCRAAWRADGAAAGCGVHRGRLGQFGRRRTIGFFSSVGGRTHSIAGGSVGCEDGTPATPSARRPRRSSAALRAPGLRSNAEPACWTGGQGVNLCILEAVQRPCLDILRRYAR